MILILVNLLVSLGSTVAAGIALVKPASLSGSSHLELGELFYVRMYAARAVPFGMLSGFLPLWFRGPVIAGILFTAAAIQILDVLIAVRKVQRGMMAGASVAAVVHVLCGIAMI